MFIAFYIPISLAPIGFHAARFEKCAAPAAVENNCDRRTINITSVRDLG